MTTSWSTSLLSRLSRLCRLQMLVNRSTFVNKKSREQFQLCDYKRLIDIYSATSKTVDALMKLELPSGVEVEIKV